MAEKYYEITNGERVEITGEDLVTRKAEWKKFNDSVPAMELEQLRSERNAILTSSDWVVVKAQEKGTEIPSSWITYRQELRDITKTFKSLNDKDFKFPDKPED
tara:strand:+ start:1703 stop:2011 length:309 start_codon:yes stop_codon:yes gene_type:complete